uniref:Uncharacterized protein n=1 Tax=Oryza nivara TaxID=4536 RepID=A0A0E0ISB8_ORYNI
MREPRLPLESIPPSHIASPGSACRCRRHIKGSHGGARPTPAPPVASPLALLTARWLAPHTLIGSCNAMREKAHHYIGMVRENSLNILEFVPGRSIQSLLGGLGSKALGQIMLFSNICEQLYGGPWRFARAAWHHREV